MDVTLTNHGFLRDPPKIRSSNLKSKVIPSWGYFVNTMDWILLIQVMGGVLFVPIITQCKCNTPIMVYYKSFGNWAP